ncbi:MAG: hypothetical protein PHU04_05245 [Candidatus Peribacteraceae bacterium]|nr:hypothetical protein [Candidatus Peribacteraceae bacterium]
MKIHVLLACLIGFLAVGYTLIAPVAYRPDSVEMIAHFRQRQGGVYKEASSRLFLPPAPAPSFQRGVTALA